MVASTQNAIIPRWEWRMFAPSLKQIEDRVGDAAKVGAHVSSEIYLLHLAGSQNAKIRDNIFDVKQLQKIDANGLELWEPVFKAKFPLSRADVAAAFGYWNLVPKIAREAYSVDQFIDELVTPQPALTVARVTKSRRGFQYAGCASELVQLMADSQRLESFSLEDEQPARIMTALRELALDSLANTNYPKALKAVLGWGKAHDALRTGVIHGE